MCWQKLRWLTISPHSTIFSPRTMKIPRGISPNCLPTCIRSIVSCNSKLAVESIKSNFPRILITCDSHQTGQHCGDIQSGFVHLVELLVNALRRDHVVGNTCRFYIQSSLTVVKSCAGIAGIENIRSFTKFYIPVKHEHAVDGMHGVVHPYPLHIFILLICNLLWLPL